MGKYLLEVTYGGYRSFNNILELDKWRKNSGLDGILYTEDGHLVNEKKMREYEIKINKEKKMEFTFPKSKHKMGYTKQEVLDIIRPLKIHHNTFWKKFGVNTCTLSKTGETLYYGCDIKTAIRCCLEKRDKYFYEWD